jgi:EAL domain-containing protein (putative c-di-GMP-specific phosphodiesterase class I)
MARLGDERTLARLLEVNLDAGSVGQILPRLLRAVRSHLEMDVAFVSEFTNGQRVFRYVDSLKQSQPVKVGGAEPLEASYCQRVVDGRLPELIQDAATIPAALELPVTKALPVGAHVSVPIRLKDGRIYGTFCCFSFKPDHSLNQRDLQMMRVFADLSADAIDRDLEAGADRAEKVKRIQSVLDREEFSMVYQPIIHVEQNKVVGYESLTRFTLTPARSPDVWFNEAASVGMGAQLEIKAVKLALVALDSLPQEVYLSFNVSPEVVISGEVGRVLEGMPLDRIVLEITEHATIVEYEELTKALAPLRTQGLRLAVDDAGAGYASFRHILRLQPDIIKLDMSLTRDIDTDSARRALASALIRFAQETGSKIVAEGVETATELSVLRSLGVNKAQGYLLGRPAPLAELSTRPTAS